jgi:NTE family protein
MLINNILFMSILKIFVLFIYFILSFGKNCNILSFSGGGSFGALEIGILDKIKLSEYDMITGISAGGLNAGFLSYYNNNNDFYNGVENLKNIISNLKNSDVYYRDLYNFRKKWSYYNTQPLNDTLYKHLKKSNFSNKPTIVGATDINLGVLKLFEFEKYNLDDQVNILLASSAIPFAFPPVKMNDTIYVDGGLISNEILIGITSFLSKCDTYNITFISPDENIIFNYNITYLEKFIDRIISLVYYTFNDQIKIIFNTCKKSVNKIYHYYPIPKYFSNYSHLNFNYGKDLLNIGYNHHRYDIYSYCI